MGDVFISYAREEQEFVRKLHDALTRCGREPWVDWEDIPPTARWMEEIETAIIEAHDFAFLLSAHSIASRVCNWEVNVAAEHNKRLVPLVRADVPEESIPQPVRDVNWLFFRDEDNFEKSLTALIKALDTDIEWVHTHTRLELRAMEWKRAHRDFSLLLRGNDLRDMVRALAQSKDKRPAPTMLQRDYVRASEEWEQKELQRRKTRELVDLARTEQDQGRHERAALLARQAYIFNERSCGSSKSDIDNVLRLILGKPFFCNMLCSAEDMTDWVKSITFSPDGKILASGNGGGTIRLWDLVKPGKSPTVLKGQKGLVESIAFSPSGSLLVAGGKDPRGSDNSVKIWDLTCPDRPPRVLGSHERGVMSVAFTPDGRYVVSAGYDGAIRLWMLSQVEQPWRELKELGAMIDTIAISPDGQWLAGAGEESCVRLWPLEDLDSAPKTLSAGKMRTNALAFSPDGQWLATGNGGPMTGVDDGLRLWNLKGLDAGPKHIGNHHGGVESVAFSPDSQVLATGGRDANVLLWDLSLGQPAARLELPGGWVETLAFSPDGQRLAAGNSNTFGSAEDIAIRVWYLGHPLAAPAQMGEHEYVSSVSISPSANRIASADFDGTVRIWDQKYSGEPGPLVLPGSKAKVNGGYQVAFGGEDYLVCGGADGRVRLWELGEVVDEPIILNPSAEHVNSVTFAPNARCFAVAFRSQQSGILLWDPKAPHDQPKLQATLPQSQMPVALAFSPNASILAGACYDGAVRLWQLGVTQNSVDILRWGGSGRLTSVAFSPNGKAVAAGGIDRIIFLWDLTDRSARPARLVGHGGSVEALAFSPDGSMLASASRDKTTRLWNLKNPGIHPIILKHEQGVDDVTFFPSDPFLLTASGITLHAWSTSTQQLVELVCEAVWRNFTEEEWAVFVGDDFPYENTCRES